MKKRKGMSVYFKRLTRKVEKRKETENRPLQAVKREKVESGKEVGTGFKNDEKRKMKQV